MTTVAKFNAEELNNAMVSFVPARVTVEGTTMTAKRLHVVEHASEECKLFAVNMTGKVGKAARGGLQEQGMMRIASAARRGHYKPLAEALALITGEAMFITSRNSYESLVDRFDAKVQQLENDGKAYKADGKMTPKMAIATQSLMLINAVRDGVEAIIKAEQAE